MAKARVDIDGYNLALKQGTGIATYGRTLAGALRGMGAQVNGLYGLRVGQGADPLVKEMAVFDPPMMPPKAKFYRQQVLRVLRAFGGARAFELPVGGKVARPPNPDLDLFGRVWNVDCLYRVAHDYFDLTGRSLTVTVPDPPQVMHWTYPVPVKVKGAKNIYTLHDLVPLKLPYTTLDRKDRYLTLMRLLAREADHLVTVSERSKADIVELLGVAPERVTNTWQAAAPPVEDAGLDVGIEKAMAGSGGYFLFVGAIEPKKNVGRLIEGYLRASPKARLVLVGKKAWKWEEEFGLAELLSKADNPRIIHLDYVPAATLAALMRGAKAVCFPSLYEGFGLPVLEALQLGAPVMTANTGSLPEVAGDAALMVDPYDTGAIADALTKLDGDPKLRARLSKAGLAQAAKFSPAAYRARLAELYGRLGVAF